MQQFWNTAGSAIINLLALLAIYICWALRDRLLKRWHHPPLQVLQARDNQIYDQLKFTIARIPSASRIYLSQFRNGSEFDGGNPIQRLFRTHEVVADGVSYQADAINNHNGLLISQVPAEVALILENGPSFKRVEDLERGRFKYLCLMGGVKAVARCAVLKGEEVVAMVGVDFNLTDEEPANIQEICDCAFRIGQSMLVGDGRRARGDKKFTRRKWLSRLQSFNPIEALQMNRTQKIIVLLGAISMILGLSAMCGAQPAPTTSPADIADRIAGSAIMQGQYVGDLKTSLLNQAATNQKLIDQANAAATAATLQAARMRTQNTQLAATTQASAKQVDDLAVSLAIANATIAKLSQPPQVKDVAGIQGAVAAGQTTVTVSPGTYRQALIVSKAGITIDGGALGQVVFDGADPIAGWTKDSSTSNPVYSAPWLLVPKINGAEYAIYDPAKAVSLGLPEGVGFGSQFIWQAVADDVVHEANLIQRVDYADAAGASHPGRARLAAGTFYIDKTAGRVYIWLPGGANPAAGQVLGSSRAHPISGPANTTLKNIVIRHACNFAQDAMLNTDDGWKLVNVICERANAGDISVNNKTISLDNVTAQYGGQLGFAGHLAKGTRLTGCTNGPGNNAKGFSHGGEASCKFAACDGLVFDAWKAFDNFGNNTWLDVTNGNITFTNSVFSGKGDLGLISEIGVGQLTMTNCTFDGPGGQVLIAERSNDASKLSSGPYTFGVDINHCVLKNGASIQLRGLPLGSPPRLMPINVSITYNQLIDSFIATNAGVFDASSITTNHYTIDHNQYSGAGKLIHWGNGSGNAGVDYGTLASVRTALHIEANGTSNR